MKKNKRDYIFRIDAAGKILGTWTIAPSSPIYESNLKPIPKNEDLKTKSLNYFEMVEAFYEIGGEAYKRCKLLLENYCSIEHIISSTEQIAGNYSKKKTLSSQIVDKNKELKILEMSLKEGAKPENIKRYVEIFGMTEKAESVRKHLNLSKNAPFFYTVNKLIDEAIEDISLADATTGDILDFTYRKPEYAHLRQDAKGKIYANLHECTERTYRNRLEKAIQRVCMYFWGVYPNLLKDDIFTIIDGKIQFIE